MEKKDSTPVDSNRFRGKPSLVAAPGAGGSNFEILDRVRSFFWSPASSFSSAQPIGNRNRPSPPGSHVLPQFAQEGGGELP